MHDRDRGISFRILNVSHVVKVYENILTIIEAKINKIHNGYKMV